MLVDTSAQFYDGNVQDWSKNWTRYSEGSTCSVDVQYSQNLTYWHPFYHRHGHKET